MGVRHVWNGLALGATTIGYSMKAAALLPFDGGRRVTKVAQTWAHRVNALCGVEVAFEAEAPLDAPSYLVMSNHSSHFDVLAIFDVLKIDMRPVAKRELAKIPVFGWVLKAGAAVMIDRGDKEKAKASIDRAAETIRGGRSVLMFPEGTRTETEHVQDLKKGPFYLAVASRVPILPVAVIGTPQVLRPHDWRINPGKVSVRVGTPIETAGRGEDGAAREALREEVAAALEALVAKGHIVA